MVGLVGLEPTTPALSRRCSNQLSYRPFTFMAKRLSASPLTSGVPKHDAGECSAGSRSHTVFNFQPIRVGARISRWLLCWARLIRHHQPASRSAASEEVSPFSRKEVIQPHLPIRLPCYDFTPVTNPAVVIAPLAVRLTTSGRTRSHGVTGGVYKTRERIHRGKLIRDY
jgi:hypothetical protein